MGIEKLGDLFLLALESEVLDSIFDTEAIDYLKDYMIYMKCCKLVLH